MTVAEDGSYEYDPTIEFMLQTSNGSTIANVSDLKTALKNGDVIIRPMTQ